MIPNGPLSQVVWVFGGFVRGAAVKSLLRMGTDGSIRTTFPESQVNTLGMFYNGRTSRVDVSIHNNETEPITVHFIGGAFQDLATLKSIHNVLLRSPTFSHVLSTLHPLRNGFNSLINFLAPLELNLIFLVNRKRIQLPSPTPRRTNLPLQRANILPRSPRSPPLPRRPILLGTLASPSPPLVGD